MHVRESRPFLAELVKNELDRAMEAMGRGELRPLLQTDIAREALWYPLLEPALDDFTRHRDKVTEYLRIVKQVYLAEQADRSSAREALELTVLEELACREYYPIVKEVDPELAEIIVREIGL